MSQLLGVGGSTIKQIEDSLGTRIDTSGLPALTGSVNAGRMGHIDPNTGKSIQTQLDTSGLQSLDDPSAIRQQMMDSAYQNFSDRFDPIAQRQQQALQTRQANMGGVTSSQGARQQLADLMTGQNDARSQAIFGAQRAGQDAAEQVAQRQLANRGQQFGERATQGQFANSAQSQLLQQALSAMGFNNAATQQDTQNAFQNANLGNATRAQGLTEQQSMRQMALNELMAMLSGTQVQGGNFGQQQGSTTAAAPIFGAAQAQGQAALAAQNAAAASGNSMMSGLGSLGAAALPLMFSDRRLKSNIRFVGRTAKQGIPIYDYDMGGIPQRGVMSDEVPEDARVMHASGFWMVDYNKVD
jgi:hypothetical protein